MSILKPRTVPIPIYQGDDAERLAELRMAVSIAERQADLKRQQHTDALASSAPRRVADDLVVTLADVERADAHAQDQRDAYDAFVDEAAERAVEVVIRGIGSRRFRELLAEHPPRKVKNDQGEDVIHEDDVDYSANYETFPHALLTYAEAGDDGVRTIIAPAEAIKSGTALRDFLDDELNEGVFQQVFATAYWHNRSVAVDPKGNRYSPSTSVTSE